MASRRIIAVSMVLLFITVALGVVSAGVLSNQNSPSAQGSVSSTDEIAVYNDQQKTSLCTEIDWGTIAEGDYATYPIYVENTGNSSKVLHLSTSDWQPQQAEGLLTLSWDRESYSLPAGSMVEATLTLSAAWDVGDLDTFDFNLVIEGIS